MSHGSHDLTRKVDPPERHVTLISMCVSFMRPRVTRGGCRVGGGGRLGE